MRQRLDAVTHELRRVDRERGRPHDAGAERVMKRVLETLAIVNGRFVGTIDACRLTAAACVCRGRGSRGMA